MSDIDAWLTSLGLGQFAELFRDNLIDAEVLPNSDRRRSQGARATARARARRSWRRSRHRPAPATELPASSVAHGATSAAERRQLTVMFVDLVGSTALSAKLDPEEMGDVLRGYPERRGRRDRCGSRAMSPSSWATACLAYFGWPVAHEDEAERAVRAGLAIVAAVGAAQRRRRAARLPDRHRHRPGRGRRADRRGAAQEQTVVGETPNLAARLQGVAEPGQVVIAETTRQLVGRCVRADAARRRSR